MRPRLYSTLLLYILSALRPSRVGTSERPRLVVVFEEAHLLFDDAPGVLLERIDQVVRLIRSKGVGVWFVTQNPLDIPETVLGQLGNRVQHALRAYTPKDQRAVRAAAETFRSNPALDVVYDHRKPVSARRSSGADAVRTPHRSTRRVLPPKTSPALAGGARRGDRASRRRRLRAVCDRAFWPRVLAARFRPARARAETVAATATPLPPGGGAAAGRDRQVIGTFAGARRVASESARPTAGRGLLVRSEAIGRPDRQKDPGSWIFP